MFRIRESPSRFACGLSLALGLLVAGCGGEELGRTLDATVTLDLPDSLPAGSPLDIGFTWTPGPGFETPADDYRVFVHVVDPDGNIVEQDDHFPPLPTSQWTAGEPVTYRRLVYPAPDFRPDYVDFYVGLYDGREGGEQVATMRDSGFHNRPLVHTVVIRGDDQGGLPVPVEGWNEKEVSLSAESKHHQQWQWMRKTGVVAFGNPRGPSTLHLRAQSPVDFLGGPQTVTLRIGDREIAEFEVSDGAPYLQRFEIPADALGDGDWIEITLEVNEAFVPAQIDSESADTRELGLQVFSIYLAR